MHTYTVDLDLQGAFTATGTCPGCSAALRLLRSDDDRTEFECPHCRSRWFVERGWVVQEPCESA